MGLEAGTFVSDLVTSNPLAGDKKNVGDDHLRLIKTVLKNTFPGANRPYSTPFAVGKSDSFNVTAADDGKLFVCATAGAAFGILLPVPGPYNGFIIRVAKTTFDVGPVFVSTATGQTINSYAAIRISVPFVEHTFFWDGSFWTRFSNEGPPGEILWCGSLPVGYGIANGQSNPRTACPELFSVWSTMFGAVDGASFSAPNLLDRFPIAAGASFPIGSIGGVAAVTLTASQIPSHQHTGTTDGNNRGHTHQINSIKGGANTTTVQGGGGVTAVTNPPGTTPITEDESQNHTHTFTTGSIGGDGSHTNMPPYFGLLPVFRLC